MLNGKESEPIVENCVQDSNSKATGLFDLLKPHLLARPETDKLITKIRNVVMQTRYQLGTAKQEL